MYHYAAQPVLVPRFRRFPAQPAPKKTEAGQGRAGILKCELGRQELETCDRQERASLRFSAVLGLKDWVSGSRVESLGLVLGFRVLGI